MKLERLTKRAAQLRDQAEQVLTTVRRDAMGRNYVDTESFHSMHVSALAFLESTFGEESAWARQFGSKVRRTNEESARRAVGILSGAHAALADGWIFELRDLVAADLFADFMEMAEHLLSQGYKDAAAVVGGSILEGHLRHLGQSNRVPTEHVSGTGKARPKKADQLNADLAKAGVYNKLEQKNVTAWLGLRNFAAHGQYGEYTEQQVRELLSGVTSFTARVR